MSKIIRNKTDIVTKLRITQRLPKRCLTFKLWTEDYATMVVSGSVCPCIGKLEFWIFWLYDRACIKRLHIMNNSNIKNHSIILSDLAQTYKWPDVLEGGGGGWWGFIPHRIWGSGNRTEFKIAKANRKIIILVLSRFYPNFFEWKSG